MITIKRHYVSILLVALLAACQSTPNKKPLAQSYTMPLEQLELKIVKNNGIQAEYFRGDSTGFAVHGLILGGIIDSINNSLVKNGKISFGSRQLSQYGINKLYENFDASKFDDKALELFSSQQSRFSKVVLSDSFKNEKTTDDTVKLNFSYQMSPDFSSLTVMANAKILSSTFQYDNPYDGGTSKDAIGQPIYLNSFKYVSNYLDIPIKSQEEYDAERLAIIQEFEEPLKKYKFGNKAKELRDKKKKKIKELKKQYTQTELVDLYIKNWLLNDAEKLKATLDKAYYFVLKSIKADFNTRSVPSFEQGENLVLSSEQSDRITVKIGNGVEAGSYVSKPKNERVYAWDSTVSSK